MKNRYIAFARFPVLFNPSSPCSKKSVAMRNYLSVKLAFKHDYQNEAGEPSELIFFCASSEIIVRIEKLFSKKSTFLLEADPGVPNGWGEGAIDQVGTIQTRGAPLLNGAPKGRQLPLPYHQYPHPGEGTGTCSHFSCLMGIER